MITGANEVFARKVALENMDQSAAYACAYNTSKMTPKSVACAASALATKPEVAQRIVVLRERATQSAVKAAAHTRDAAIDEAEKLLQDAHALGQISAGVAAAKLKAQLAGHLDEKKQDAIDTLADMDASSLVKLREAVEAEIARSREALEMTGGDAPAKPAAVPVRRVL